MVRIINTSDLGDYDYGGGDQSTDGWFTSDGPIRRRRVKKRASAKIVKQSPPPPPPPETFEIYGAEVTQPKMPWE